MKPDRLSADAPTVSGVSRSIIYFVLILCVLIPAGCSSLLDIVLLDSPSDSPSEMDPSGSPKSDNGSPGSFAFDSQVSDSTGTRHSSTAVNRFDDVINNPASPARQFSVEELIAARKWAPSSGHGSGVIALFPASDAGSFVSVDKGGSVLIWKTAGSAFRVMSLQEPPLLVDFNASTWTLAVVDKKGKTSVYQLTSPDDVHVLEDFDGRISAINLSPDGRALLLGGADSRVYRWRFLDEERAGSRMERAKTFERYVEHGSVVSAVESHPMGRIFFSGDWLGRLNVSLLFDADRFGGEYDENLFEGRSFAEKKVIRKGGGRQNEAVSLLRCTPDGKYIILGDESGRVELWQVRGFRLRAFRQAHRGVILDLAASPDSTHVASLGRDGRLVILSIVREGSDKYDMNQIFEKEVPDAGRAVFVSESLLALGFGDGRIETFPVAGDVPEFRQ